MITIENERLIERPREVNKWRAAGILYGDLGTSKAYVLGLAFAFAGYSSFWYILAICILTLIVCLNYIEICRVFPDGGGVYTSARSHSKVLALIGGFFLISDYIITASLSSVSAFHYLGLPYPQYWAMFSIAVIGLFNWVGPKHTGNLAIGLAIPTFISIVVLGAFSLPFLPEAVQNLQPISGDLGTDWSIFVGIVVALSGIESIANTTGSMKLNPGSTPEKPSVSKTSTRAILMVLAEVCIFVTLLGLAMNALPGLSINNGEVSAPGYPNVRDSMLRYMAEVFGGTLLGPAFGHVFSLIIGVAITFLLLSAVNTAIMALISILFIMSKDKEMPYVFQKLNGFGVPKFPLVVGSIFPIVVLFFVSDVVGLANLYAIGFVGAICVNLVATSTNRSIKLKRSKRIFMFLTSLIMIAIEATLFIEKPEARAFVLSILGFGLLMRALVKERQEKNGTTTVEQVPEKIVPKMVPQIVNHEIKEPSLVVVTGLNKSLDFAIENARKNKTPLYVLFVREQRFVADADRKKSWKDDQDASYVFRHLMALNLDFPMEFLYVVTSETSHYIVEIARLKNINKIIIGRKRKLSLMNFIRGTTINELVKQLPNTMDLVVIY